jgi:hypothetical protein
MLVFIGDLHGTVDRLWRLNDIVEPGVPFVQVGDLGWWRSEKPHFEKWGRRAQRKLYWIRGNHEDMRMIPLDAEGPVEVAQNIVYIPGGHAMELDGRRIGFLGGGASVDYKWRTPGLDWFPEENILPHEEERAMNWGKVDLMVTHAPPQFVIERHFPRSNLKEWALDYGWTDPNAVIVSKVWANSGRPPLICGHMHKSVVDGNIRLLDINEAMEF